MIAGLALLIKVDVQEIFDDSIVIFKEDVPDYFKDLNKKYQLLSKVLQLGRKIDV